MNTIASEEEALPSDIRPLVARASAPRAPWLFGIGLAITGGLLFYTLEMRRERITEPSVATAGANLGDTIAAPPDLQVPSVQELYPDEQSRTYPNGQTPASRLMPQPFPQAVIAQQPARRPDIGAATPPPPATTSQNLQGPPAPPPPSYPVYGQRAVPDAPRLDANTRGNGDDGKERVLAERLANPSTTVPKGTVIQAVLETALDSTRAGFARAIVSRDVSSFDGSRVLIQRGSRIIGEYKSDVTLGQKRVLIQWERLTRPDGAIIEMNSPSADPLGRAGVTGKVYNHFLQRFAGAILQSALNIGTQFASQRVSNNTVYVGLPGLTQGVALTPDKIEPTVRVKQGSSVSVFVARDLDFTPVE